MTEASPSPRLLRKARHKQGLLRQNPMHKFAADRALFHYASNSVYTFIPKNGCTSMRLSLAIANGAIADSSDWQWVHSNNTTFTGDLAALATARFTFVILRCPYRRLVSTFLDKMVSREPPFWSLCRMGKEDPDPAKMSFRSFVELLGKPGRLQHDPHWRPQENFLVYENYDRWYAFEHFNEACADISKQTGMQIHDARSLSGHSTSLRMSKNAEVVPGSFADASLEELYDMRRNNVLPSHHALYDDTIRAQVAKLFAIDIDLYTEHFGAEDLLFAAPAST
mgnify:CR=1 FL=1